jgi:predicted negative regulator of RcsB-dependent stress response
VAGARRRRPGLSAARVGDHTPLILVELVLVFGGVLAFAWWQLRDVKRAQERSAAAKRAREAAEREDG